VLTISMAIGLVTTEPDVMKEPWMQIKLGFVLLLVGYHHYCKRIMKKLAANECKMTGQQFRWFNEIPTVFFVIVVMLAVFKNSLPLDLTTWLIAAMVIGMVAAIQLYARKRRLASEQVDSTTAIGSPEGYV